MDEPYPGVEAVIDRVGGWVRFWQDAATTRSELGRGGAEVARMAHALGLTARELATLRDKGSHAADLLPLDELMT